ncbi:hypothetical protein [Peribacillus deserti]|uniref:hypothetical protein n=1 Tax=Peribacillus deserti TaxID=673318 RepID=UPI0015E081BA|nr:hypothetical protein [Peribacillus deserti]
MEYQKDARESKQNSKKGSDHKQIHGGVMRTADETTDALVTGLQNAVTGEGESSKGRK